MRKIVFAVLWWTSAIGLAKSADPVVLVCSHHGVDEVISRAQMIATQIFVPLGVRLRWSSAGSQCAEAAIRISYSHDTPRTLLPNALAYSRPFADPDGKGVQIEIFRDRVIGGAGELARIQILAHVIAHELGHVLGGSDWHSVQGVMRARWSTQDLTTMQRHNLGFSQEDVLIIRAGVAGSAAKGRLQLARTGSAY
jgi:hypothetical protein